MHALSPRQRFTVCWQARRHPFDLLRAERYDVLERNRCGRCPRDPRSTAEHAGGCAILQPLHECLAGRCAAVRNDGDALVEMCASGPRDAADVVERLTRVTQELDVTRCQCAQRLVVRRGQHEQIGMIRRPRLHPGRRRFLQDHVRVRAAEAERADACAARPFPDCPGCAAGRYRHRQCVPRDVRIRCREVQVRRNLAVLQTERRLDQSRDAGRRFQVAQVRLGRAKEQRLLARSAGAVHRTDRLHLDGIAERRTGAVGLDVVDVRRLQPCVVERGAQHRFLGWPARRRQPAAAAVLVDRRAADHRVDAIAIAQRITQSLEHDDAHALTAHVAVARRVERLAAAVAREHARTAEVHGEVGCQHQADTRCECGVALATAQRPAREMHGHE